VSKQTSKALVGTNLLHLSILTHRPAWDLRTILAFKNSLAVLIELNGGDDNVAGVNTKGSSRPVDLVTVDAVNMNYPFFAVHLGDLALSSLMLATDNQNFVIFADG